MKNILAVFFVLISGSAMAQESYLKAGANLNLPVLMRGITSVTYPPFAGVNLSYERMLGKHTSFVLNLESSRRINKLDQDSWQHWGMHYQTTTTQFSLVPEFRVYVGKTTDAESKGQGFFLQVGLPLLSYNIYHSQYQVTSSATFESKATDFDYLFSDDMGLSVPFGFGLKYPFKSGNGIEVNFNTDLEDLLNQEKWQTFQMGIKYFWQRKK